jgi:hypothetical protein
VIDARYPDTSGVFADAGRRLVATPDDAQIPPVFGSSPSDVPSLGLDMSMCRTYSWELERLGDL